uniref:Ig-like domain-containing protein n=1 Tax=Oreochromis niloticus TaxID=8128 RepID=A0A669CBW2_ORENI
MNYFAFEHFHIIIFLYSPNSDSLVPMKIVQLGEPVTLTCALPSNKELSTLEVHWYKQSIGDGLKLISTLYGTRLPQYGQEIFRSRYNACNTKTFSNLTILKTVQEDEGIYHCGIIEWHNPEWSGTYLLVKGDKLAYFQKIVLVCWTVSDPVNPADTTALQCSVFSDSDNNTYAGDHDVFWFRAGSDKSHPSIIYTGRKRSNECEKPSDLQNRCVYRFSKNISSSDEGTYYCAVATCGEILFGNGTEPGMIFCLLLEVILKVCWQHMKKKNQHINFKFLNSHSFRRGNFSPAHSIGSFLTFVREIKLSAAELEAFL